MKMNLSHSRGGICSLFLYIINIINIIKYKIHSNVSIRTREKSRPTLSQNDIILNYKYNKLN